MRNERQVGGTVAVGDKVEGAQSFELFGCGVVSAPGPRYVPLGKTALAHMDTCMSTESTRRREPTHGRPGRRVPAGYWSRCTVLYLVTACAKASSRDRVDSDPSAALVQVPMLYTGLRPTHGVSATGDTRYTASTTYARCPKKSSTMRDRGN